VIQTCKDSAHCTGVYSSNRTADIQFQTSEFEDDRFWGQDARPASCAVVCGWLRSAQKEFVDTRIYFGGGAMQLLCVQICAALCAQLPGGPLPLFLALWWRAATDVRWWTEELFEVSQQQRKVARGFLAATLADSPKLR